MINFVSQIIAFRFINLSFLMGSVETNISLQSFRILGKTCQLRNGKLAFVLHNRCITVIMKKNLISLLHMKGRNVLTFLFMF